MPDVSTKLCKVKHTWSQFCWRYFQQPEHFPKAAQMFISQPPGVMVGWNKVTQEIRTLNAAEHPNLLRLWKTIRVSILWCYPPTELTSMGELWQCHRPPHTHTWVCHRHPWTQLVPYKCDCKHWSSSATVSHLSHHLASLPFLSLPSPCTQFFLATGGAHTMVSQSAATGCCRWLFRAWSTFLYSCLFY